MSVQVPSYQMEKRCTLCRKGISNGRCIGQDLFIQLEQKVENNLEAKSLTCNFFKKKKFCRLESCFEI